MKCASAGALEAVTGVEFQISLEYYFYEFDKWPTLAGPITGNFCDRCGQQQRKSKDAAESTWETFTDRLKISSYGVLQFCKHYSIFPMIYINCN